MKLQQLKYFVAVYEHGSFSAAAEPMNATQSGLSMHVSQLEQRYGVTLFLRSSSGVAPTETGRRFYDEAVRVLAAAARAEDRLRALSKSLVGHIRIGLMPTFTRAVLAPTVQRFAAAHPDVTLSVSEAYSGVLGRDVAEGRLDLAVVPVAETDPGLQTSFLARDRECLVASARGGLRLGSGAVLRSLPPLRVIMPGPNNARRRQIETYLKINGIEPREVIDLDTMHGTLDMVARSDWVAILPGILCLPDLDGTRRQVAPLADPSLSVEYMMIARRSRPPNPAATAFADILRSELDAALRVEPVSRPDDSGHQPN